MQTEALGALASIQQLLLQLLERLPSRDSHRRFDATLPSAAWLLGSAVFLELRLLRSRLLGDEDMESRIRHLFGDGGAEHEAELPPQAHLLEWAAGIFDEHLFWLANPGPLREHQLLQDGSLIRQLAVRHALVYEHMLAQLRLRNAVTGSATANHQVSRKLSAAAPDDASVRIEQGHYRIGARDSAAQPNEQPAQIVELHAFRIARRPVSNAQYLAFMLDGGYEEPLWWSPAGKDWRLSQAPQAPWHWRRDPTGHWFQLGINGPLDLDPDEPVGGLCAHEAHAFAAWAAASSPALAGAVPQHEYQWEVAARLGEIEQYGRVWEWCANRFAPYSGYRAPAETLLEPCRVGQDTQVLRGGCLHSQPGLRHHSFRLCGQSTQRHLFAGTRLVMPPGKAVWQ